MIQMLKLLLPALIPSWNFFDVIADAPRVEYALSRKPQTTSGPWTAFRPRPDHLAPAAMVGRLFWNARWNESLFVVSCAERLLAEPTKHSEDEIFLRIAADLADGPPVVAPWLRFRIALVSEQDDTLTTEIAFTSEARRLADIRKR